MNSKRLRRKKRKNVASALGNVWYSSKHMCKYYVSCCTCGLSNNRLFWNTTSDRQSMTSLVAVTWCWALNMFWKDLFLFIVYGFCWTSRGATKLTKLGHIIIIIGHMRSVCVACLIKFKHSCLFAVGKIDDKKRRTAKMQSMADDHSQTNSTLF